MMLDAMVIAAVERRARRCAAVTHQEFGRGLTSLATIVSGAPLLGLFGTILGILNSFPACTGDKSACLAAVVDRLSHALMPAAFGLLVALPTLWGYRYLRSELEAFDVEITNTTSDLINRLSRQSP